MTGGAVVVLTNERDLAADDIIRRLDTRGVRVKRLNVEAAVESAITPWSPGIPQPQDVGAVWWRQFELPVEPGASLSVAEIDDLLIQRAQWRSWIATLATGRRPWINDLWAARRAESKVVQLDSAVDLGFDVPATLITNDRAEAARFLAGKQGIVKSLAAAYFEVSQAGFVYTQDAELVLREDSADWSQQPMIVQQYISGADVRVVVVGDECFGASCTTAALDWRTVGPTAVWGPWEPPPSVSVLCRRYCTTLGLRYAAFDFIDDGSNQWFLEANQAGEWTFLERRLNLGIAESLVDLLAELAEGRS